MQELVLVDRREELITSINKQLNGDYSKGLTSYSYLAQGAEDFIGLINNPDYTSYKNEIIMLEEICHLLNQINVNRVIDLGIGEGAKGDLIVNRIRCNSYVGVDISQDMIEIGSKNQKMKCNRIYRNADFSNIKELNENIELCENDLYLLLGNTLANEVNMKDLLGNMNRFLNGNHNYLLIGIELFPDNIQSLLREYRNEENYRLTFKPLEMIGVKRENGIIEIDFNKELNRIEEKFRFIKSQKIEYKDNYIDFQEGREILLSVTIKPTIEKLREDIAKSRWYEEEIIVNKDNSHALILLYN